MAIKSIVVWTCPTPECRNYFGASGVEHLDLTQEATLQSIQNRARGVGRAPVTGYRSHCPDCKAAGRGAVDRVRCRLVCDPTLHGAADALATGGTAA